MSASAATDGLLAAPSNYIRNSVKVVVDAYNGTSRTTRDLSDPIIQAWSNAFPGMFTDINERARRPRTRTSGTRRTCSRSRPTQFAKYHVSDPTAFYQRRDFWQIPPDPTQPATSVSSGGTPTADAPVLLS